MALFTKKLIPEDYITLIDVGTEVGEEEEEEERVNVTVRLSTSQSATEHYLLARVRNYLHLLSFHANISKMLKLIGTLIMTLIG